MFVHGVLQLRSLCGECVCCLSVTEDASHFRCGSQGYVEHHVGAEALAVIDV